MQSSATVRICRGLVPVPRMKKSVMGETLLTSRTTTLVQRVSAATRASAMAISRARWRWAWVLAGLCLSMASLLGQ